MLYAEKTDKIIEAFFKVYNSLGYGFLEKVYENAMIIELRKKAFAIEQQTKINVYYEEKIVGDYFADIIVDNQIILELKAAETICDEHIAQLVNYLKATKMKVGLLFNFGKTPEFKRAIFANDKMDS